MAAEAGDEDESLAVPITTDSTMAVLSKPSRLNVLTQGPPNPQNAGLLAMIAASEHEILSLNPALNIPAVKRALEQAILLRGVTATLILSLHMNKEVQHRMQGGDNTDTAFEMYTNLLARGGPAAADRLKLRWASADGERPALPHSLGNNHAKTALYDGEALWVGSMNWDWQSWSNSREVSVVVFDPAAAPRWHAEIWQPLLRTSAPLALGDLPQCLRKGSLNHPVCRYLDGIAFP